MSSVGDHDPKPFTRPLDFSEPSPATITWSERLLERVKVAALTSTSRQLIEDSSLDASTVLDFQANNLVHRIEALVTVDPHGRKTGEIEVVGEPQFDSWRAHRVAALPPGSIRRYLLATLYRLPPDGPFGKRSRYRVSIRQEVTFPEHGLPDSLGTAHRTVTVSKGEEWEPAYIDAEPLAHVRGETERA